MKRNVITFLTILSIVFSVRAQDATIEKFYYQDGLFKLKQNNQYGLATFEDSLIIPIAYKSLSIIGDNIIKATNPNDKIGLITFTLDTIVPFEFDRLDGYKNGLVKAYSGQKFGMLNDTGGVVIPFEYSYLSNYSEDKIAFRKDGSCGVMDVNQEILIPASGFRMIREFNEGYAIASEFENGKYGIINTKGEWVVEPKYSDIFLQRVGGYKTMLKEKRTFKRFENNTYETYYGYINPIKNIEIEPNYSDLTVLESGNFFVVDTQSHIINREGEALFSDTNKTSYLGTSHVKIFNDSLGKYAILDGYGKLISDFEFGTVSYLMDKILYGVKDGQTIIYNIKGEEKARLNNVSYVGANEDIAVFSDDLKLYFFDMIQEKIIKELEASNTRNVQFNGNNEVYIEQKNNFAFFNLKSSTKTALIYDSLVEQNEDGYSVVEDRFNRGVVNENGKLVLPIKFSKISSVSNGKIIAQKSYADTTFVYNYNGDRLFALPSDAEFNKFNNDMLLAKNATEYFYLNGKGEIAFKSSNGCADFYNDRAAFQNNNRRIGFYDKSGKEVIAPKYSEFGNFNQYGLAAVKDPITGFWGYINKSGEVKIPFKYDKVGDFITEYAMVSKGSKLGQIDTEGNEVVPIEYAEMKEYSDGYFAVKKDSLWGFINEKGKLKIPFQFEDVSVFKEGLCWVKKDGKLTLIDTKGQVKFSTEYKNTNNFRNGVAIVVDGNGKYGVIDKSGNLVMPLQYDYLNQFSDDLILIGNSQSWSRVVL